LDVVVVDDETAPPVRVTTKCFSAVQTEEKFSGDDCLRVLAESRGYKTAVPVPPAMPPARAVLTMLEMWCFHSASTQINGIAGRRKLAAHGDGDGDAKCTTASLDRPLCALEVRGPR
jgi:hypothetical protein